MMNWQNRRWLAVLPILLSMHISMHSQTAIPDPSANLIKRFILFNYDNIIADYYEGSATYLSQVNRLIADATPITESRVASILYTDANFKEANPVLFMMALNQSLMASTGYYFVPQ